jgi:hypothetical protein
MVESAMEDASQFFKVCGADSAVLDVIFIHGLTGDPKDTWTTDPGNEYWPTWLCEAFGNVGVYAIGYPASIYAKWAKKELDLHERANNMLETLASYEIGKRPLALVAHSLGGLLVKEMLRVSKECTDEGWQLFAKSTKLVAFLATPHLGAELASLIKFIAPKTSSTHIDLLTNDSGYLRSLNQSYRDLSHVLGIQTVPYYEKYKMKGLAVVVSPDSADPGARSTRPIAIEADHISICKPSNRDSLVFVSLCRHIKNALKDCVPVGDGSSFGVDDYGTASPTDRRDLLQKLIDAGREHEYRNANDLQNKFAQRYYKLGLFTDAKVKNDEILAAVEQRFLTHVYAAKICKGASDDEIAEALQTHVIDPLCERGASTSATAVLQALYFLTEQCYIQWDAR